MLLATFFTVAAALALTTVTTAGAVGFGPHANVGSSASDAPVSGGHLDPSSTVAPLTQANFVVTDLASGVGTVYEWSSVTPIYSSFCNAPHGG